MKLLCALGFFACLFRFFPANDFHRFKVLDRFRVNSKKALCAFCNQPEQLHEECCPNTPRCNATPSPQADVAPLQMRLLEEKRWNQATSQLLKMIRKFDFNDDSRSSVPTLTTWLQSLRLEGIRDRLELLGCYELADLAVRFVIRSLWWWFAFANCCTQSPLPPSLSLESTAPTTKTSHDRTWMTETSSSWSSAGFKLSTGTWACFRSWRPRKRRQQTASSTCPASEGGSNRGALRDSGRGLKSLGLTTSRTCSTWRRTRSVGGRCRMIQQRARFCSVSCL